MIGVREKVSLKARRSRRGKLEHSPEFRDEPGVLAELGKFVRTGKPRCFHGIANLIEIEPLSDREDPRHAYPAREHAKCSERCHVGGEQVFARFDLAPLAKVPTNLNELRGVRNDALFSEHPCDLSRRLTSLNKDDGGDFGAGGKGTKGRKKHAHE